MRTATVTLGGIEYTIQELPSRANSEWRGKLDKQFGSLAAILKKGDKMALDAKTLSSLLGFARETLLGSIDQIRELVLDYSPALKTDEATILANAYDSEIGEALVEVLKLAFPFGSLVANLARSLPG